VKCTFIKIHRHSVADVLQNGDWWKTTRHNWQISTSREYHKQQEDWRHIVKHSSIHTHMIDIIRIWYARMIEKYYTHIIRVSFVLQSTPLLTHWSPHLEYTTWCQWVRIWYL